MRAQGDWHVPRRFVMLNPSRSTHADASNAPERELGARLGGRERAPDAAARAGPEAACRVGGRRDERIGAAEDDRAQRSAVEGSRSLASLAASVSGYSVMIRFSVLRADFRSFSSIWLLAIVSSASGVRGESR